MHIRSALIFLLIIGGIPSFTYAQIPVLEDCPVPVDIKRATPRLKFMDSRDRQFKTVIRDAAKGPINFAGHHILATWGCGANCVMASAVDVKSGMVRSLPFSVSGWPLNVTEPLSFRPDSCLLIVRGSRNESTERGTYYYMFDGQAFKLYIAPERSE